MLRFRLFYREEASVLPIFAMGLVVFLGIVGISVDLNFLFNSLTSLKSRADIAATAALRAYWELEVDDELSEQQQHQARLGAALQRAKEVSAFEENLPFYKILLGGAGGKQNNLCLWQNGSCSDLSVPVEDLNGYLIPGTWHSVEPEVGCDDAGLSGECPCFSGQWRGPCFRPLDSGTFRANAFQVELKTSENSPMPSVMARFIGQDAFRPEAIGTSTLNPRRLIFALDFSGSMDDQTDPFPVSETTYKLTSSTCPPRDEYLSWDDVYVDSRNHIVGTYPEDGIAAREPFGWSYVRMPRDRNGDPSGSVRYKSDFQCFEIPDDGLGPAAYLINTYPGPDDDTAYEGPQPLTRTLDAIHIALEEMQERGVPGDMAGMILFDRYIHEMRYFPMVSPRSENDPSDPGPFDQMLIMTDRFHPNHWQERINHLAFVRVDPVDIDRDCWDETFPGYDGSQFKCQNRGIFSNIPWALREADRMLTEEHSDWTEADNQVLLFSDLLANCTGDPYGGLNNLSCKESADYIVYGEDTVRYQLLEPTYIPKRITLNLFPSGSDNLGFHTQLMPNGKAGDKCDCLTEEEARQIGIGLGKNETDLLEKDGQYFTNVFLDISFSNLGYSWDHIASFWEDDPINLWDILKDSDPNTMYSRTQSWYWNVAVPTGGLWAVTREPCLLDPDDPSRGFGNVMDKVKAMCRHGMASNNNVCRAPVWDRELSPGVTRIRGSQNMKGWTDQRGRMYCDPLGRLRSQQLRDYMKQILSQTPYSLSAPLRSVID